MKRFCVNVFAALAVAVCCAGFAAADTVIADFEDFYIDGYGSLASDSAWYGATGEGQFASGSASFANYWSYDATWDMESWEGFACSNMTDVTTNDYSNQFSAITGGGVDGSANYAVGFDGAPSGFSIQQPVVTLDSATELSGVYITNTTYTYLTMLNGSMFGDPLGGPTGQEADWLKLTIIGIDAAGNDGVSVEFLLADYTGTDAEDYLVDSWSWVDLTALGAVNALRFEISGTDTGAWGLNTPAYFAMDNLTAVPEPASCMLLLIGAAAGVRRRRS